MTRLSLVINPATDVFAIARDRHEQRAAWLDSLAPDRSRYRGSAGVEAMKKLRPLDHDEQAHADRCEERTRTAKGEAFWRWDVVGALIQKAGA